MFEFGTVSVTITPRDPARGRIHYEKLSGSDYIQCPPWKSVQLITLMSNVLEEMF